MNGYYASVNGLRIRYQVKGTSPAIILIHGLGEFLESWIYNINELSKNFTVYAIDLPGHGLSDRSETDCSIDFYIRFIISFMEVMEIPKTSLIGHSMGGPICIRLATDFPEKVDKVILVDSGGFENKISLSYRLAAIPILGKILLGPSWLTNKRTVRLGMRRQFYNPNSIPDEWVDITNKHLHRPDRNEVIINIAISNTNIRYIHPKVNIISKLPHLKHSVLIVHGKQDKEKTVKRTYKASRLIKSSRLKIFDRCGHNPQMEKPAEFNESVLSFLEVTEYTNNPETA